MSKYIVTFVKNKNSSAISLKGRLTNCWKNYFLAPQHKFMRKILQKFLYLMLIAFIISIAQTTEAQESTTQYNFVVWIKSGETFSYPLADYPKVTQSTSSLILTTAKTEVEYSKNDVWKFTMEKLSSGESTINSTVIDNASITQCGDIIYISNCKVGTEVRVYSVSGILCNTQNVSENGDLTINLNNLNRGIYIISTESITYKIIKQ